MSKVTIRKRALKKDRHTIYLDFSPPVRHPRTGKLIRTEFLKIFTYDKPKDSSQRKHNKETMILVENVRCNRQLDIQNRRFGFISGDMRDESFIEFFKDFMRKKQQSNADYAAMSYRYFKAFAGDQLKFSELTDFLCEDYKAFLLSGPALSNRGIGISRNTAVSYYAKFRTALKEVYRKKLINEDLYRLVDPIDPRETHRERLEIEELQLLAKTDSKSDLLKRACLFSALTGLRFSDVNTLKWTELRGSEGKFSLLYRQEKTNGAESLPISDQAVMLMGQIKNKGLVFAELYYHRVADFLKDWLKRAGIDKNITFHSFRHTYATLQIEMGTDLYTVSKMLGHRSIKTTEIYAKVVDSKKVEATRKIKLDF